MDAAYFFLQQRELLVREMFVNTIFMTSSDNKSDDISVLQTINTVFHTGFGWSDESEVTLTKIIKMHFALRKMSQNLHNESIKHYLPDILRTFSF